MIKYYKSPLIYNAIMICTQRITSVTSKPVELQEFETHIRN